jgi:hypothetical protein
MSIAFAIYIETAQAEIDQMDQFVFVFTAKDKIPRLHIAMQIPLGVERRQSI